MADAADTRGSGRPAGAAAGSSGATTRALPAPATPLIGRQPLELLANRWRDRSTGLRRFPAPIGWTYELLARAEKALVLALAPFVGCFALETAEALAAGVGGGTPSGLDSLVEQGPLQRDDRLTGGGERRFWMLETVRAFALERPGARGVAERRAVLGPSWGSGSAAGPVAIRAPPGLAPGVFCPRQMAPA